MFFVRATRLRRVSEWIHFFLFIFPLSVSPRENPRVFVCPTAFVARGTMYGRATSALAWPIMIMLGQHEPDNINGTKAACWPIGSNGLAFLFFQTGVTFCRSLHVFPTSISADITRVFLPGESLTGRWTCQWRWLGGGEGVVEKKVADQKAPYLEPESACVYSAKRVENIAGFNNVCKYQYSCPAKIGNVN